MCSSWTTSSASVARRELRLQLWLSRPDLFTSRFTAGESPVIVLVNGPLGHLHWIGDRVGGGGIEARRDSRGVHVVGAAAGRYVGHGAGRRVYQFVGIGRAEASGLVDGAGTDRGIFAGTVWLQDCGRGGP